MDDEHWVDDLRLPKTEAALSRLIGTAHHTIEGIDAALHSAGVRDIPEIRHILLEAKAKAQYCLDNFQQQLAERRRLMDDENIL